MGISGGMSPLPPSLRPCLLATALLMFYIRQGSPHTCAIAKFVFIAIHWRIHKSEREAEVHLRCTFSTVFNFFKLFYTLNISTIFSPQTGAVAQCPHPTKYVTV